MDLKYVIFALSSEWNGQKKMLTEQLERDGIVCCDLRDVTEKRQCAVLITDSRNIAASNDGEIVCIGCDRENAAFFEGAALVTDDLTSLDSQILEETFLHSLGRPVTVARTNRLIIREISEEDFDGLYRISLQPGMQYAFISEENCFEPERLAAYISHVYRFYGYGLWSVLKKDGTLIGCCGLSEYGEEHETDFETDSETDSAEAEFCLELRYMLAREHQGSGYGQEMCRAALNYAFARTDCEKVLIRVHRDNHASIRLAERLGFRERACSEKDVRIFSMEAVQSTENRHGTQLSGNLYYESRQNSICV